MVFTPTAKQGDQKHRSKVEVSIHTSKETRKETRKETKSLQEALCVAQEVAREAGALLLQRLYEKKHLTFDQELKNGEGEGKGAISLADYEAEMLIRARLRAFEPSWGFRAEEEPTLNCAPIAPYTEIWLVDPNDGTSAFIKGERGSTVSIALIRDQTPVLGVIYAYAAPNGRGDFFSWAQGCGPLKRNTTLIPSPNWTSSWSESTLFVSNQADRVHEAYQTQLGGDGGARYRIAPGIAYRLALCAAGEGEAATSLANPRDFDYAAGHALLRGVGGDLVDECGKTVYYHSEKTQRLGFAFGGQKQIIQQLVSMDWQSVLRAWIHPLSRDHLPFTQPTAHRLVTDETILDRVQGAWWGWHIGTCIAFALKEEQKEGQDVMFGSDHQWSPSTAHEISPTLLSQWARSYGGDRDLVHRARNLLLESQEKKHEHVSENTLIRKKFSRLFSKELTQIIENPSTALEQDQDQDQDQRGLAHSSPHCHSAYQYSAYQYAKWGALHGRATWNDRVISELLGGRVGPLYTWMPDGDRLIEFIWESG